MDMLDLKLTLNDLVMPWYFPERQVLLLSCSHEFIVYDVNSQKARKFPTHPNSVEQATIVGKFLVRGDQKEANIYHFPSLEYFRTSSEMDLWCPGFQITNYQDLVIHYGTENGSVELINPQTDEIVRKYWLPEILRGESTYISSFNYTPDYLVAFVDDSQEDDLPVANLESPPDNIIFTDESFGNGFFAIWNIESGKFHGAIEASGIDFYSPIISDHGLLADFDTVFDIKTLKVVRKLRLPETHYIFSILDNYILTMSDEYPNQLGRFPLSDPGLGKIQKKNIPS